MRTAIQASKCGACLNGPGPCGMLKPDLSNFVTAQFNSRSEFAEPAMISNA